jgi:hypothetical protein
MELQACFIIKLGAVTAVTMEGLSISVILAISTHRCRQKKPNNNQ